MFCDGNCKKGNKRCGLLLDITMKEEVTGKNRSTPRVCTASYI